MALINAYLRSSSLSLSRHSIDFLFGALVVVGQRVRTVVGDGQIISVIDGVTPNSFQYLVKFSFGVGYVRPSAVAHLLPTNNTQIDESSANRAQLMTDNLQIIFGTEKIYLMVRLYVLLVTMLQHAKDMAGVGYSRILSSLKDLIVGKVDTKDFETDCRKLAKINVFHYASIPHLVEACADAIVKVADEDAVDTLYHCSRLKLKVRISFFQLYIRVMLSLTTNSCLRTSADFFN